jgi:opacity protein-like surface antigen
MSVRSTRVAAALAALALAAGARAAAPSYGIPGEGDASVTVLAGARLVPLGSFFDDQAAAGYRPWKTFTDPGFLLSLGYAPEGDFQIKLEIGYGVERLYMTPGTLDIRSVSILLAADTSLLRLPWMTLYGGGGIGYSLNTLSQNVASVESNSTAGYVCLGARFPLTRRLALVVEERYTLSFAGLPGPTGALVYGGSSSSINVGGNLLSVGLMFHYFQPDEHERH